MTNTTTTATTIPAIQIETDELDHPHIVNIWAGHITPADDTNDETFQADHLIDTVLIDLAGLDAIDPERVAAAWGERACAAWEIARRIAHQHGAYQGHHALSPNDAWITTWTVRP